jgi:hypothetical protein
MATDGERATEEIQWWPYLFLPCILLIAFIWTRTSYRRKLAAQLDTVAAAELAAAAHVSTLRSQYHLGELSGGWLLRATEVHPRGKRGGSITHNYQATLQLHFAVRAAFAPSQPPVAHWRPQVEGPDPLLGGCLTGTWKVEMVRLEWGWGIR